MSQQKLVWSKGPLSVYEWSKLDLGAMLHRRPIVELLDGHGQPMNIRMVPQMPRLILADGASLSVQASEHSYSSPRDNKGPYTKVEVGFPSETPPEAWKEFAGEWVKPMNTIYSYTETPPEAWKEFAGEWVKPMNTIYSYIPLTMVMLYIGAHGGIDRDATFKDYKFQLR